MGDLSVAAGVIPIMFTYDITLDSSKDIWQFFVKKYYKDCCLAAPLWQTCVVWYWIGTLPLQSRWNIQLAWKVVGFSKWYFCLMGNLFWRCEDRSFAFTFTPYVQLRSKPLTVPIWDFVMLYANILLFLNRNCCCTRTRPISTVGKVAKQWRFSHWGLTVNSTTNRHSQRWHMIVAEFFLIYYGIYFRYSIVNLFDIKSMQRRLLTYTDIGFKHCH